MRALPAMLVLCGCARGGAIVGDDGADTPGPDAPAGADAARLDAAPPDTPPPPPDAPPCVPMSTQLLANPLLDGTPRGTGWTEQLINSNYPLITSQDGPAEHTAPYKAWLGGLTGNGVTDVLYQDVAIPPLTTELVLMGFHDVRTNEWSGASTAYDTASVSLIQPGGALIATVLSLSNLTPKTAWTPFNHTFSQDLSGQMVRVRFTSRNDSSYATSFFFDTLALTAIHGCP